MAQTETALTVIERVEQSPAVMMLDARSQALVDLLPDEAAALRFRRVFIQALVKNPDLLACTPESVISSIFEAAAMGLEPTGAAGGAHLVPYSVNVGTRERPQWQKQAQLIPDYRGIIRLVTKPPSDVVSMEARVVKEGDDFEYSLGSDAWVRHTPALSADRSTKATTHVYSVARLRAGGPPLVDVEDRAGIERVQKRGKERGFSPWSSDWDEMAKKTIIKRHSKVLPVRPEIRSILVREDDLAGTDEPTPTAPAIDGPTRAARLGSKLRARTAPPATDAPGASETPSPVSASTPAENATPAAAADDEGVFRDVPDDDPLPFAGPAETPAAAAPAPDLGEAIRSKAATGGMKGPMTQPQVARLAEIFAPIGGRAARAGLLALWPAVDVEHLTAAQANAIVMAADSDPEFATHWTSLAAVATTA